MGVSVPCGMRGGTASRLYGGLGCGETCALSLISGTLYPVTLSLTPRSRCAPTCNAVRCLIIKAAGTGWFSYFAVVLTIDIDIILEEQTSLTCIVGIDDIIIVLLILLLKYWWY